MELVKLVCKQLDNMSYQGWPSSQKKQNLSRDTSLKIYLVAVSIFM